MTHFSFESSDVLDSLQTKREYLVEDHSDLALMLEMAEDEHADLFLSLCAE